MDLSSTSIFNFFRRHKLMKLYIYINWWLLLDKPIKPSIMDLCDTFTLVDQDLRMSIKPYGLHICNTDFINPWSCFGEVLWMGNFGLIQNPLYLGKTYLFLDSLGHSIDLEFQGLLTGRCGTHCICYTSVTNRFVIPWSYFGGFKPTV